MEVAKGSELSHIATARIRFIPFHVGAAVCKDVHLGIILPGKTRGNHRHHTKNETFILWGAKTRWRVRSLLACRLILNLQSGQSHVFCGPGRSLGVHFSASQNDCHHKLLASTYSMFVDAG
jgi:hypothetical protein